MKKKVLAVVGILVVISMVRGCLGSVAGGNEPEDAAPVEQVTTAKESQTKEEEATEATTEIIEEATTEAEKTEESVVTPEFKEAMDSYEAFFDEYVEFMKKYADSGNSTDMLMEYSDYLTKYAATMENMDKIDSEELSTADYAYYIEVTARIQKKLLEVSQ